MLHRTNLGSLHYKIAQLQHVSNALLANHLLLPGFHTSTMSLGFIEIDQFANRLCTLIAEGNDEEVNGIEAIVVHGVPRGDFLSPALLQGNELLANALDGDVNFGVLLIRDGILLKSERPRIRILPAGLSRTVKPNTSNQKHPQ